METWIQPTIAGSRTGAGSRQSLHEQVEWAGQDCKCESLPLEEGLCRSGQADGNSTVDFAIWLQMSSIAWMNVKRRNCGAMQ